MHFDIFDHNKGYNGMGYACVLMDEYTSMAWVFTTASRSVRVLAPLLERFFNMVRTQFDTKVAKFRHDGEGALIGTVWDDVSRRHGLINEPSAPRTPAQNGRAERAGGVISAMARTIIVSSRLPPDL
jgi:hypothetical protein